MTYADLVSPPRLRALLERHGLWTRRALGQHFLVDRNIVTKIVQASGAGPEDRVFEVGPGLGVVTRPLGETARQVLALELDERLLPVLAQVLSGLGNVRVVPGDILRADLPALLGEGPWLVVANLPYYITTPAISRLLAQGERFGRMTLMVQREVAARLASPPGSKDYGSLSVHAQSWRRVEVTFAVPASCFYPPPQVESAVVVLDPLETPVVLPERRAQFEAVVRAAFGQRRKRLGNALASGLGLPRPEVDRRLEQVGISPGRRAEELAVAEFVQAARALGEVGDAG